MKKLHLGCGKINIPGYINIDIQDTPAVDIQADISNLDYEKGSIDFIYSCANIEHFSRHEWRNVLSHWYDLLKKGATLRLSTADFDAAVKEYLQTKNIDSLLGLIVGGQKDPFDRHGMIFDYEYLKKALEDIGFKNIRRYRWQETDIAEMNIDDYSQAYLPHMDKKNGRLMMLNIEADK